MDISSQARCRNTLTTKTKMALPGNHFSDFVSAVPGRIPSVLKVAQCNHSRYCQFAALGVLPGKKCVTFWYHSVLHGCILQAGKGESQEIPTTICFLSFTHRKFTLWTKKRNMHALEPQCQQHPQSIGQTFSVSCFWSHQKIEGFLPHLWQK